MPSAIRRCDSAPALGALELLGRLAFPLGQADRPHDGVAVGALALPEVGLRFLVSHRATLRASVAMSTSAPRTLARDLLPFLASLRESDGNRLPATFHLPAFPALATPQGAPLPSTHRSFDVLTRALAISPPARFLRRHMNASISRSDCQRDPGIADRPHVSCRRRFESCPEAHRVPSRVRAGDGNRPTQPSLLMAALSSSARDGTPYSVKRPDRDMSTAAFALNVRLSRRWLDRSHARWQDRPEMADGPSTQGQLQDRASSVMLPSTFSPAPAVWPYGPDHDLLRRAGHRDEGTSSPDK